MKIKQDPITKLWCREDGAVLMPPCRKFKKFRWTFGTKTPKGYRAVRFHDKYYEVHRIACRAFNGLPPADKPFVDHIDRCKTNNTPGNLHWVSHRENCNNKDCIDRSVEKYKVRYCENRKAYNKAYWAAKCAEKKAQGLQPQKRSRW